MSKEAHARIKINKLLEAAGWRFFDDERGKANIALEPNVSWPTTSLESICVIATGKKDVNQGNLKGVYPFFTCAREHTFSDDFSFDTEALLIAGNGDVGHVKYFSGKFEAYQRTYVLHNFQEAVAAKFVFAMLQQGFKLHLERMSQGNTMPYIKRGMLAEYEIPLPPLEVQHQIVAEIEGYQKIIDGARQVLDNYKPHIVVDSTWPRVILSEIVDELESGVSVNSENRRASGDELGILKTSCVTFGVFNPDEHKVVLSVELGRVRCPVRKNSIIISRMNTEALVGANAYVGEDYDGLYLPDCLWQTVISRSDVDVRFVQLVLASQAYRDLISSKCGGTSGSMKNIAKPQLLSIEIPLPDFPTQRAIVAEIEAEQALVNANRELIRRMEAKVKAAIDRVWGD